MRGRRSLGKGRSNLLIRACVYRGVKRAYGISIKVWTCQTDQL